MYEKMRFLYSSTIISEDNTDLMKLLVIDINTSAVCTIPFLLYPSCFGADIFKDSEWPLLCAFVTSLICPYINGLRPFQSITSDNLSYEIVVLGALVALVTADTAPAYGYPAPPAPAPAKYDFNYAVKDDYSGNDFGHQEARDGYDTQGSYYVQLPDGRLQKVSYTVNGDSGFVADVTYEGEAQYPEYKPAPPAYA
ncbi:uncharacterized protein LOC143036225 [Oratosquilla oratoria]|uniref:uncharacterized protein LOC143036225 n=1 Tax=Oratosquilla oratoria TaxID=337810 RepID=UPI003F76F98F